jgi:hypothetical protein
MFITFIFRLPDDITIYYGKINKTIIDFCDINDIYLDNLIRYDIINSINAYQMYHNKPLYYNINFGILGTHYELCSDEEKSMNIFDLYINNNEYIFKGYRAVIEYY